MSGENSTNCLDFNLSRVEYIISNTTITTSSSFGVVSSLFAIVIICYTKAYKEHIHRLLLYLSVMAFISSLSTLTDEGVRWARGIDAFHHWIIVPRLVMGYALTTYYLLLCWVALYILSLARHWVCFKKARHEVLGLVLVLASFPSGCHMGCSCVWDQVLLFELPISPGSECWVVSYGVRLLACGFVCNHSRDGVTVENVSLEI